MFEQVGFGYFIQPVRIATAIVTLGQVLRPGLPEVTIHSASKPLGEVPGKLRKLTDKALLKFRVSAVQIAKQKVRIGVTSCLAKQLGGSTTGINNLSHRDAVIVLGVGIAKAVANALPIICHHVGYAVFGASNLRVELEGRFRLGRRSGGRWVIVGVIAGQQWHDQHAGEDSFQHNGLLPKDFGHASQPEG